MKTSNEGGYGSPLSRRAVRGKFPRNADESSSDVLQSKIGAIHVFSSASGQRAAQRESRLGTKCQKYNRRESSNAAFATKKLSPDSPAPSRGRQQNTRSLPALPARRC